MFPCRIRVDLPAILLVDYNLAVFAFERRQNRLIGAACGVE
jgi:hypothetical protein